MSDLQMTVGLFGTCGGSRWREPFKQAFTNRGIAFFDPQRSPWKEEDAAEEARHLVEDGIILFPVTAETSGLGSLAETGFSMFQAMKTNMSRYFVFMVEETPDESKMTPEVWKESKRARALVRAHLKKNPHPNVFLCQNLEDTLQVSLSLYESLDILRTARNIALH